ncbi:MAG: agarase [Opitutales bacterium]
MRNLYAFLALALVTSAAAQNAIPKTTEPIFVDSRKRLSQEWKPTETYTIKQLDGYVEGKDEAYSKFGGIASSEFEATGFFRTQKHKGRWWLIDPEGHLFIHKAVCAIATHKSSPSFTPYFEEKFGSDAVWAEAATEQMWDLGFNGAAAWSKNDIIRPTANPLVYVTKTSFMGTYARQRGIAQMGTGNNSYKAGVIPVFDPEFAEFADEYAKRFAATKDDPYLLGHFSDNEMPLRTTNLEQYLALDPADPGYVSAHSWLAKRKGKDSVTIADADDADKNAFLGYVIETYGRIVSGAIKKYDPNHLYLGHRMIRVFRVEDAVKAYAKHADVMTFNYYGPWMLPADLMASWAEWVDRPFIISEWYAKGLDTPHLTNEAGAGWMTKGQKYRGYYYQNMVLNLLAARNSVGWHWFRYGDNDMKNTKVDPSNTNSNKGIINYKYELYTELTDQMKEINTQVYRIAGFFDDTDYEAGVSGK